MAKDIKVIFRGNKAPSGKTTNIEYMISAERKKLLDASKMFDIEVVDSPKPKPKKKKSSKKGDK